MANRTVKDAKSIKGTNPQYLVEKIIRSRIYDSKYWKEECFALTAELLVDKAMELRFVGGVFGGNIKPTPFLCLTLKMLQIQPEKDIIVEFIKNEEFKYVRALGAFYMRLTGTSMDCYSYLEPLLNDYRKLRRQNREGAFEVIYMDEYVDDLLREERACDIILPRMQKRNVLEETNQLAPHISVLEDDEDDEDEEEMDMEEEKEEKAKKESSRKAKKGSSSKSSSSKGDRKDKRRRRSNSSDSGSSDDYDRKQKPDYRHEKESRDRKRDRSPDSRSQRKDKKKDRDPGYERRDKDRERSERDRTRGDRGREHYGDHGRSRDSEKDRDHRENRDRERESDRHRSSRRHDY